LPNSFEALGVLPFFTGRLEEKNIVKPLEIQEKTIPLLLQNKNLVFSSPTGTGKTYAYLLPMLGKITEEPRKTVQCLIAAPTYELCSQIKNETDFLLQGTGINSALVIGQTGLTRQIDNLKKSAPAVVIGNAGRLLLLVKMGKLSLKNLRFVIYDEGDRLVSDELLEETRQLAELIYHETAEKPQLVSCSATFSVKNLERLKTCTGAEFTVLECPGTLLKDKIEHWAIFSETRMKTGTLRSFIAAANPGNKKGSFKALVFIGRAGDVGRIVSRLQAGGLGATGLFGDMNNRSRRQSLEDFRSGRVKILVASDLSARGLDIQGISHVIALDPGTDTEAYIHRAGRTARAGKKGIMVTIGNEAEMRRLASFEKKLGIAVYPKILSGGRIVAPV